MCCVVTDQHSGLVQFILNHFVISYALNNHFRMVKGNDSLLTLVSQHTHHDQRVVGLEWIKVYLTITLGDGVLYVKC